MSNTLLLLSFFFLGFLSQIIQNIQIREVLVVFYGNEVSFSLFFVSWLLWISVGGLCYFGFDSLLKHRKLFQRCKPYLYSCLVFSSIPALVLQLLATNFCREYLDIPTGEIIPIGQWWGTLLIITMPTSFIIGLCFPLGISMLKRSDAEVSNSNTISWMYIFDAFGSLFGGVILTNLVMNQISHSDIILGMVSILFIFMAFSLSLAKSKHLIAHCCSICLIFSAFYIVVFIKSGQGLVITEWIENKRWQLVHPDITRLHSHQTPYSHLSIGRLDGQYSIVNNGSISVNYPDRHDASQTAALIMGQWSLPKTAPRILYFGGPMDNLVHALIKYPLKKFSGISVDPVAWRELQRIFPREFAKFDENPRIHWESTDGRQYINRMILGVAGQVEKYDIVIVNVGDPSTASVNRYFTKEAFQNISSVLSDNGFFTTDLTAASNYIGKEVKSYSGSIYWTLHEVFRSIIIMPGDVNRFFASNNIEVLTANVSLIQKRYSQIPLKFRDFPTEGFSSLLEVDRVDFLRQQLEDSKPIVNTDFQPITYFFNMILWGRFTSSKLAEFLTTIKDLHWFFYLVPLVVFTILRVWYDISNSALEAAKPVVKRQQNSASFFAVAFAAGSLGFVSMVSQILLIYNYQNLLGYVYERIGLLNGVAMFGLGVGAFMSQRYLDHIKHRQYDHQYVIIHRCLIGLLILISVCLFTLPDFVFALSGLDELTVNFALCGLIIMMAFFTGFGFPFTMFLMMRTNSSFGFSAACYEIVDNLGGVAGALFAGAIWLPLLGAEKTSLIAIAFISVSILLLVSSGLDYCKFIKTYKNSRFYLSFPYKKWSFALFGITISIWMLTRMYFYSSDLPVISFDESTLISATSDQRFSKHEEPFVYYDGFSTSKTPRSYSLSSMVVADDIYGYGGPINLLISMDATNRENPTILHASHIGSHETPSYIVGIDDWLAKFEGRGIHDEIKFDTGVDTITGATITCKASVQIINKVTAEVAKNVLDLNLNNRPPVPSLLSKLLSSLTQTKNLVILTMFLLFLPVYYSKRDRWRRVYLMACFIVLGVVYNVLFTLVDISNLSLGNVPDIWGNFTWYLLVGFVLITSILWGQVYCGFVCPFGAIQELIWYFGKKIGFRMYASRPLDTRWRFVKFVILPFTLCAFWTSGSTVWITFNPMQYVFSGNVPKIILMLTIIIGIGSLTYYRFWCRYFCPTGAFLALFNKMAIWRKGSPRRVISKCDLGVRAEFDLDCIQCNRCIFKATAGHDTTKNTENDTAGNK